MNMLISLTFFSRSFYETCLKKSTWVFIVIVFENYVMSIFTLTSFLIHTIQYLRQQDSYIKKNTILHLPKSFYSKGNQKIFFHNDLMED